MPRAALLSILASSAASLAALAIIVRLFSLPADFLPFHPVPVVMSIVVGVSGAAAALVLINRISSNPFQLFYIAALIALLLSFVPNALFLAQRDSVPIQGVSLATMGTLGVLHVITAAVTVALFSNLTRDRRGRG